MVDPHGSEETIRAERGEDPDDAAGLPASPRVVATDFAHPSERIAAQILDFYEIAWEYEPTTFPIEWDGKGNVVASFTPDFFLPDFDLYIELTTMNQRLVTKKNRKVRRLRELYPDVKVKIFYQKDFKSLLLKYGLSVREQAHAQGGGLAHDAACAPENVET